MSFPPPSVSREVTGCKNHINIQHASLFPAFAPKLTRLVAQNNNNLHDLLLRTATEVQATCV